MPPFSIALIRIWKASQACPAKLFGAAPTRLESDYAKWMVEDPRINFAISTRGAKAGVDHLGIQTDTEDELVELKACAEAADMTLLDVGETSCCYARSDKYWLTDPQGIAWEQFHTLGDIPVYGAKAAAAVSNDAKACCAGSAPRGKPVGVAVNAAPTTSCC